MGESMTNDDVAWVIVRAFGIYFLAQAVLTVFYIFSLGVNLVSLYAITELPSLEQDASHSIVRNWTSIGIQLVELLFFVAATFYFLRKGRTVHRLITRAGDRQS